MKNILILGAGRSSTILIQYLLEQAKSQLLHITVADTNLEWAQAKVGNHSNGTAVAVNALEASQRDPLIQKADVVISMIPARFHIEIVKACIQYKKSLITPSYLAEEIKVLHDEAVDAGILVLNEMGLDPGIDHMSAMKLINNTRKVGGEIVGFESFTGGLIAPESCDNPWGYKFTWNPRNVVLAGNGGAVKFLQEGQYKYIPYHRLFQRTEVVDIDGLGKLEGYANRDSLSYKQVYGLEDVQTIFRGTLRNMGFCKAWDTFVQLGATDDSYKMENVKGMSYRQFFNSFLAYHPTDSLELKLMFYMQFRQDDADVLEKLKSLGLFDDDQFIEIESGSPAEVLQHILEKKWSMQPDDKDMIVMWHKLVYRQDGKLKECQSSMVVKGENQDQTAMAKTVGLPLAMAALHMLNGDYQLKGMHLPIHPEIYLPVLKSLEEQGITFTEKINEC